MLQEWAKQQGVTLTFGQLEVFYEETIQESGEKATPAETMGLKLKELREGNEHGKKGIISENLGATLMNGTLKISSKYMRI